MNLEAAEKAYWNLVVAAKADEGISPEEQKVLNAHVVRLGLDADRARGIQSAAVSQSPAHLKAPSDPLKGLETMRALLEVAAADGSVSPGELKVARTLAEHLRITKSGLESLVAAALDRSARKRDRAFGRAKPSPGPGDEVVYLPPLPDPHPRGGFVRFVPFVARLAPASRTCGRCGLRFADRNPYAVTCRVCTDGFSIPPAPTPVAQETLFSILFALFLVPAGLLAEQWTGLWSWGNQMGQRSAYTSWRRRRGDVIYILPAVGVTIALAWLPAWGLTWLFLRAFRKRPSRASR
jgi:hypothetical protein